MVCIIGLCGPSGSGKDLVADFFVEKGFVKVAFSDPMKRFCRNLFGCSSEDLWGPQSEKNRPRKLSESQWCSILENMQRLSKDFLEELPVSNKQEALLWLWNWLISLYKDAHRHDGFSLRIAVQTLGTEWGRYVDQDLWVNYLYKRVYPALLIGAGYSAENGILPQDPGKPPQGIVVVDHRYLNEVVATLRHGGFMIRLHRPERPKSVQNPGIQGHASEQAMNDFPREVFQRVLELPEGGEEVRRVLEELWLAQPWSAA